MQAYELLINAKTKPNAFSIVSPDDFQVSMGQSIDPQIIFEQSNLSLYCLDHANKRALFVETPADIDLLQAPFYFIAQYEAAERLIAVPYDTFHALAETVTFDPKRIVLFYSTGRCGSTLMSRVINSSPAVVSYSEPDVFSQLVKLYTAGQSSEKETATLLRDSALIMAAHAQQQGYQHVAFKFRSYVLSVSHLLYQTLPAAKILLMYRNALMWGQSFSRAFGASDERLNGWVTGGSYRYMIPSVNRHLNTYPTIRWIEYLAYMWVETMQTGRKLQQHGATVTVARFEELQTNPHDVVRSVLTACGLPMPNADVLAQVLDKDSQAGTAGARDKAAPERQLTDAELAELAARINKLDPELTADTRL